MKHFKMKTLTLAALLAAGLSPAYAASYYVVVPVPNHTAAAAQNISVSLTGYSLPAGLIGTPYAGFDFKSLLSVTGDPGYTGYGLKWSIAGGSLPAGLTLNSNGTLSGTPTAAGTSSFQVMASYKTKAGQQAYQVVVANLTVALATGAPPQALVGQAYGYDLKPLLSVTGDTAYAGNGAGVTWSVVSSTLPAGLYLTSDGWIGGTPTAGGTGNLTARATYKGVNGQQTYQVVTLAINVGLASATPPQGIVGEAYSYDVTPLLSVTGDPAYTGPGQVTWSLASGSLPAGLSLGADGVITGTPTAAVSGPVTLQATYRGTTGQQTYQLVTLTIAVGLASATPPQAVVGTAYTYDLTPLLSVSGDTGYTGSGVTWSVASGTLPAGLTLSSSGVITGTPTAASTTNLTARATYRGVNGVQTYQVVSLAITVGLASATPPQGIVGQAYTYDLKPLLTVTGDSAYSVSNVSWSVVSGSLPSGLSLGTDGVISGTPSAANTGLPFTIQALYKTRNGQQAYQVVVSDIVVTLSAATLPNSTYNQAYSFSFAPYVQVSGDPAYSISNVTWSVASGTLPAGLSLNPATGVLSGKPSATTSGASFTVQAAYKTKTGQYAYSLIVARAPVAVAPSTWGPGGATPTYYYQDQTVAASCNAYHTGSANYAAAVASGYYWVNMGSGVERAYCDMTTAGGGWTLVARSGGAVVTNSTYCNSGASGVNTPFGWSVARGAPDDTSNPYSMGVFSRSLPFTEVLIGDASGTSNSWGAHVYEQPVPPNFKTALASTDVPLSVTAGFAMAQYSGHTTDTTQYFFRDVPDGNPRSPAEAYGLHADGWQTCYGDGTTTLSAQGYPAAYGGNINYRHGMLMVR